MARTVSIQLQTLNADLASDFGLSWATKLFGEEAIASLPVRASGKNKGKPKGFVIWRKAATAGYSRDFQSAFAAGQLTDAWIGAGMFSTREEALRGKWLGRSQPLAATASGLFFFEEGRARQAAEQARDKAEFEARYADAVAR